MNLVIASGTQMVTVPNVEGLSQDAATTAITGAKLTVGTVTQQSSNTVAIGHVIAELRSVLDLANDEWRSMILFDFFTG